MALKKFKRVCQMKSQFYINFKEELPERLPVYLSIDGENFVL